MKDIAAGAHINYKWSEAETLREGWLGFISWLTEVIGYTVFKLLDQFLFQVLYWANSMSAKTSFDLGIDVKRQNRKLCALTTMCVF